MTAEENGSMVTKSQLVCSEIHTGMFFLHRKHPAISHLELLRVRHAPHYLHIRKRRLQLIRDSTRHGRDTRLPVEYGNSIHSCYISSPGSAAPGADKLT